MELSKTQSVLERMISERFMDCCSICVSLKGNRGTAFSSNADMDTLFDIASMGKVLVTTPLILKAIDDGLLSLHSTLEDMFGHVPADKKSISVQQLLTHTSGVVRYEYPRSVGQAGHEAVLQYILDSKLGYSPGTQYVYSCNGMMLLGFMLEKLYGKELDEIWREQMKAPLSLTRSDFNIPIHAENAAVSYHRAEVGALRADDVNVYNIGGVSGAGGEYWTARDLSSFCEAVLRKSPLLYSEPLFALAEKDYTPTEEEGRGLGWLITDERYAQTGSLFPKGSFGHTGWTGTSVFLNRELDLYAVILTNTTRWTYVRENYQPVEIDSITHRIRQNLHDAIFCDLQAQALLS